MEISSESVIFYLPSNGEHKQFGPYKFRHEPGVESEKIADHIKALLSHPAQKLGETAWWCEPPRIPYDYILVLVRPEHSSNVRHNLESAVYVVQMPSASGLPNEAMSLEKIKSYINQVFGPNAIDGDSLQASNEREVYSSGSILLASPPSRQPPIKPDDNQPVIRPAEESPPASFHSCRLVGDEQTALVTSTSLAVAAPGKEQLPHPQNIPFLDLRCSGNDNDEIKADMGMESHEESVTLSEGEDLYRKSHDEIRQLPNSQLNGPGHQTQDLVLGLPPLKLQASPLLPTKDEKIDADIECILGEDADYRSLQLELFRFAEQVNEEREKIVMESASFPQTYTRKSKAKKRVHWQSVERRERIVPPSQKEDKSGDRELQQKVHTLEHVYNQECFLKNHCRKPPSSECIREMKEMTQAHREGKLDAKSSDLLKRYITTHCQRCSDPNCKVPHMAAGCPQPGMQLPSTVELNSTQHLTRTNSVPNCQPQDLQQSHKFTDGRRVFTQATDDVITNQCNRMYVGLAIARPHNSEDLTQSTYTGNRMVHAQATDSEEKQALESLQNGCFPSIDACRCQLDSHIKKLVYCSQAFTEATGFMFGSSVAESLQISERLGKGGNGEVFKCSLCSRDLGEACSLGLCKDHYYAAKFTHYRQRELCIWSKLKHENVTALHGVVLVPLYRGGVYVYQLMPLMSSTFQKEVDSVGNLHTLICEKKMPSRAVTRNVHHICREVSRGLCYLHSNHIYHGDMKGSNTFICKQPSCRCVSTFLCMCPPQLKSRVYIGDFDSANYFTPGCEGDQLEDKIKVLHSGTRLYRSPEAHIGCMGPWCDMWSIGCIIVYSIMGHLSISLKAMNQELTRGPSALHQYNPLHVLLLETVNAYTQKQSLLSLCKDHPEPGFSHLSRIAEACLNLDFHKRMTAEELYNEQLV